MWVLGLKGLIKPAKQSLYSRGLRNGDEGRKEKNSPAHVLFPRACRSRALIVRPLCINTLYAIKRVYKLMLGKVLQS